MRHALTVPLALALAAGSLAFSDPIVAPDADESCTVIRGGETATEDDDILACRADVWFHDAGAKVGNVQNANDMLASWDGTAPDTSVAGGAGGGVVATSVSHQFVEPHDPKAGFAAAGTYEGAIEDVAVEMYLFPPAGMAQSETSFRVDAQLLIDGHPIASLADVTVPMETAGDAVQRIRFAFTDLSDISELYGIDLAASHDVELRVHGTGAATSGAVFVYDSTEVPAGMVINPPAALLAELG